MWAVFHPGTGARGEAWARTASRAKQALAHWLARHLHEGSSPGVRKRQGEAYDRIVEEVEASELGENPNHPLQFRGSFVVHVEIGEDSLLAPFLHARMSDAEVERYNANLGELKESCRHCTWSIKGRCCNTDSPHAGLFILSPRTEGCEEFSPWKEPDDE